MSDMLKKDQAKNAKATILQRVDDAKHELAGVPMASICPH